MVPPSGGINILVIMTRFTLRSQNPVRSADGYDASLRRKFHVVPAVPRAEIYMRPMRETQLHSLKHKFSHRINIAAPQHARIRRRVKQKGNPQRVLIPVPHQPLPSPYGKGIPEKHGTS